jgi:predicted DNA-binding transcriptional regulator YafY
MPSERKTRALSRCLEVIELLSAAGVEGLTRQEIEKRAGKGSTFFRDLSDLRKAGLEIDNVEVDGRRVYRFARERNVTRGLDAKQRASLSMIRRSLARLEGTPITRVLDTLLSPKDEPTQGPSGPHKVGASSSVIEALERALAKRRRLSFYYRGDKDCEPRERDVEPVELRLEATQLYLLAWDLEADALKTFKPARMERARVLPEPCRKRDLNLDERLKHSVRIWDGEPANVVVRIAGAKGRYVHEWPLRDDQDVTHEPDGSVLVRATVAGNIETLRWVLSWGAAAEVIEPLALRALVARELRDAAKPYAEKMKRVRK